MTNKEIINQIIELYSKARITKFPASNIVRAKSHTISSDVEDLIAYFFSTLTDAEIIIDKPLSVQLNGKRKTIYPDIVIKRENIITNFFDIKMDLGWKRFEFPNYCIEKSKMINELRGQHVDVWGNSVLLGDELKYEIIVISKLNIPEKILLENMKKIFNANINDQVPIYFLTNKIHPNYGDIEYAKKNIERKNEKSIEQRHFRKLWLI